MSGPAPWRSIALSMALVFIALGVSAWLFTRLRPRHCAEAAGPVPAAVLPAGLTLDPVPAAGLVVTSLRSDGQAKRLGVHVGDVIERVDGQTVHGAASLRRTLRLPAATPITVLLRRGGERYEVKLDRTTQACHDA